MESVSNIRNPSSQRLSDSKSKVPSRSSPAKKINSFQTKLGDPKCPLCSKEAHVIRKCPRFLKMDVEQKLLEIKRQHLCLNCFSKAHALKSCTSKHSCYRCQKRLNTLLHRDTMNSNTNQSPQLPCASSSSSLNPNSAPFPSTSSPIQSTQNQGAGVTQTYFTSSCSGVLLGTAIVDVCRLDARYRARVLIDPASEGSFITESLSNCLVDAPSTWRFQA